MHGLMVNEHVKSFDYHIRDYRIAASWWNTIDVDIAMYLLYDWLQNHEI